MTKNARAPVADRGAAVLRLDKLSAVEDSSRTAARQAVVPLAAEIEAEHQAAVGAACSAIEHAVACGLLLIQAKASVAHGEWLPWIEANLSFDERQARKYMRVAAHADQIGLENADLTIDGALALVAERSTSHTLRVMGSSDSIEWYTPLHIVGRTIQALGEIDTDPCWTPASPVPARTTYTIEDDGLARPWTGRVFMNPPFGGEIDEWIAKLVAEYEAGAVTEAIALVPAARRVDR